MKTLSTHVNILSLVKATLIALIIMVICSIVIGLIAYFSSWMFTPSILYIGNYLSVFGGSFYMGRKSKKQLWLNGLLVGILYVLFLTVISGNLLTVIIQWSWIKQVLIVSSVGLLGGVVSGFVSEN